MISSCRRIIIQIAYWFFAFMFVLTTPAWAYIDPATTTYIIQIAAAIVITLGVSLSIFLYRFQIIITNIRVSLHALTRRLAKKRSASAASVAVDATAVPASSPATSIGSLTQEDESVSRPIQSSRGVGRSREPKALREFEAGTARLFAAQKDALATGLIDYLIPVSENYPALAETTVPVAALKISADVTPEKAAGKRSVLDLLRTFGKWLWADERTFKQRLSVSVLIAAGLSMTYMMFPMFDSTITNESEIPFTLADVAGPILLLGLIAFVILALFLVALRGRFFNLAISVALACLICGYLQITFFNSSVGQLIGTPLDWENLGVGTVLANLFIWAVVFALVLTFGLVGKAKVRRFFGKASLFVPVLVVVIQLVALFSILPSVNIHSPRQGDEAGYESSDLFLTWQGINEVSSQNNIIVFVLDTFDAEYVNGILREDPHIFDFLDGFTYFPNNVSVWNSTYPAVINYMTGVPYEPSTYRTVYTSEAYSSGTFITDIRAQGYSSNVYMDGPHCYYDGKQLLDVADNLHTVSYTINVTTAVKRLIRLNLLKVTPLALKSPFWLPPDLFKDAIVETGPIEKRIYWADDVRFYKEVAQGLAVINESPHFSYYHLNGSHAPRYMNAQAQFVEEGTTAVEQTRGCFFIINEYFRQMKELGIYEDATIIITGDHPEHQMHKLLDAARPVGLFVKPSGSADAPMQVSNAPVSIDNLRATCVQAAGGNSSRWGKTYFEVGENDAVERFYHHRYTDGRGIHYTAVFRIVGDANDWNNWELVSQVVQDHVYWF